MNVKVSRRLAAALAHYRKCEDCRETHEIAIDDAIGCLSVEFAPLNARLRQLQEECAEIVAEKMRLVKRPIPKELTGRRTASERPRVDAALRSRW